MAPPTLIRGGNRPERVTPPTSGSRAKVRGALDLFATVERLDASRLVPCLTRPTEGPDRFDQPCLSRLDWQNLQHPCPFGSFPIQPLLSIALSRRTARRHFVLLRYGGRMVSNLPNPESGPEPREVRKPLQVAILLFDDVEVLDFAGPFEVFAAARSDHGDPLFDVVTVALSSGPVIARHDLTILPACTSDMLDRVDILIVPGGFGTRREMHNAAMIHFIRDTSASAQLTLSVCTGALLLGAAGLLDGRSATTHWAAMNELRMLDCGADVHPEARIVDNGELITSAGVSAGIDASLHIVSRTCGQSIARETARYLEYDWPNTETAGRTLVRQKS
jgi:putative intracellular protease/amidase